MEHSRFWLSCLDSHGFRQNHVGSDRVSARNAYSLTLIRTQIADCCGNSEGLYRSRNAESPNRRLTWASGGQLVR